MKGDMERLGGYWDVSEVRPEDFRELAELNGELADDLPAELTPEEVEAA